MFFKIFKWTWEKNQEFTSTVFQNVLLITLIEEEIVSTGTLYYLIVQK